MIQKPRAFTARCNQISKVLMSDAGISESFDPKSSTNKPNPKVFKALWDTGATNSVITDDVVNKCNLKPISMTTVNTVSGSMTCPVFLVNIWLPDNVVVQQVHVTQGKLLNADILIGMDIIGIGDFAITNHNNKTTFSFRFPSSEEIDFVAAIKQQPKIGRNSPCPCGSGKKYKRCCGA